MKEEKRIKKFVVDASFILAFLLPDEQHHEALNVLDQYSLGKTVLIAPTLLPYEIINGLKGAILRKRITFKQSINIINEFLYLSIPLIDIHLQDVLEVSTNKELSVYDASYLYLAKTAGFPLLTLDEKLKKN